MPTFVVSDYVQSGQCDRSGKDGVEVIQVACDDLGFSNKYFSLNAFRDDVRFFCPQPVSFSGSVEELDSSARIRFYVTGYQQEGVCAKSCKTGECFVVSCPRLGYTNRLFSRTAFRDEVRFHAAKPMALPVTDEDLDSEIAV